MQVRFCLKVSVYSWGYGIWVSSTSFQKSIIGWPQQPPTEKVLNFNMIFHDSTKTFFSKLLDLDGWIIPGTKMTNTCPFLWNGSSKIQFFTNIWYLFCRRLLRLADTIFLKTVWWNSNGNTITQKSIWSFYPSVIYFRSFNYETILSFMASWDILKSSKQTCTLNGYL